MATTLHGWNPEIERSFKETLYRFLEEVNCTKAVLYLLAPDGSYLLATQYGFGKGESLAQHHESRSPIVLKARELRDQPLIVNHRDESGDLFELLTAAGSQRMLLTPLYGESRLAGFVDARDKGRQRSFTDTDARTALTIGADLIKLIRMTGIVDGLSESDAASDPDHAATPAVPALPSRRGFIDRIGLEHFYRCFTAEIVREPGISLAALTLIEETTAGAQVIAGEPVDAGGLVPLFRHSAEVARKAGILSPAPEHWTFETTVREDRRRDLGPLVIGASVLLKSDELAIVGAAVGCADGGTVPRVIRRLARRSRELSDQAVVRFSRARLARNLLGSTRQRFLHLERHSESVSALSWKIAQGLGLSLTDCDAAGLAGYLHDVGMIDLEYERLYRLKAPGPVERKKYRHHVVEGERIAADSGLEEIRGVIRHHHERWDGRGYPEGLAGTAIPLLARIVHAAEVWDVLTSNDSYRQPVGTDRASEMIRAESGRQFDPTVVEVLFQVV